MSKSSKIKIGGLLAIIVAVFLFVSSVCFAVTLNRPTNVLSAVSRVYDSETSMYWEVEGNYYFVDSIQKMRAINTNATTLSRNYLLTKDLNLSDDNAGGNYGWVPIGMTDGFKGTFDGKF